MSNYVIDPAWGRERERLAMLEEWTDPMSERRLAAVGLEEGWQCLEVGAGSGSVARWMSERVGPSGRVVALDIDTRFLEPLRDSPVEVVQADLRADELPAGPFDLVHGRAIIHHLDDPRRGLERLAGRLKPGGVLLIEEPDAFAALTSSHAGWLRMWQALAGFPGLDVQYGRRLVDDLRSLRLDGIDAEVEVHLVRGATRLAQWHRLSATVLRDRMVAAGLVTDAEADATLAEMDDPDFLEPGFAWFAGWGRQPRT